MLKVVVRVGVELVEYLWYHVLNLNQGGLEMYSVSGITTGKHLVLFVGYLNWLADKGVTYEPAKPERREYENWG